MKDLKDLKGHWEMIMSCRSHLRPMFVVISAVGSARADTAAIFRSVGSQQNNQGIKLLDIAVDNTIYWLSHK